MGTTTSFGKPTANDQHSVIYQYTLLKTRLEKI